MFRHASSLARVDAVAGPFQGRAHEIEARQRQRQERTRAGGNPPSIDQVFSAVGDNVAKAGRGGLDAKAQEAEDRLEDHHACNIQYRDESYGRQHIRHDQKGDDSPIRCAHDSRRADELLATLALGHTPRDASIERPAR